MKDREDVPVKKFLVGLVLVVICGTALGTAMEKDVGVPIMIAGSGVWIALMVVFGRWNPGG